MPGMIYEKSRQRAIVGKRSRALEKYIEAKKKESMASVVLDFKQIVESLITGDVKCVPNPLHILLDASREPASEIIRWIPFHFEYVMERFPLHDECASAERALACSMAELCKKLLDAKELSGDGWEALFVLFLLARCIAARFDDVFVPRTWFSTPGRCPIVYYNAPYGNHRITFGSCKNWADLREGLRPGSGPAISVYYPSHAQFKAYDVIAVYSDAEEVQDIYGYQLKEGKADTKQPVESEFCKSIVVKGIPPAFPGGQRDGWDFACGGAIDNFFGTSGKYWTPQQWKRLAATVKRDDTSTA